MACEDCEPEDIDLATTAGTDAGVRPEMSRGGLLDRIVFRLSSLITSDAASHCLQKLLPGTFRRALVVLLVATARALASGPVALR